MKTQEDSLFKSRLGGAGKQAEASVNGSHRTRQRFDSDQQTVEHFIQHCPRYQQQRTTLIRQL